MFELDLRSRAPIYEQLVEKLIELMVNGVLKADEQLPTVRTLAAELTINPNTIQKAYRELEHRGYIYSVPGKGSFVKPAVPGNNLARLHRLENKLAKLVAEMLYLGASRDEISQKVEKLLVEYGGGNQND